MKHLNYYETLKAYADDNVGKYTIPTVSYIKENNILKYKKDAEGLVARWKAYDKTNNDVDKNVLKDHSGNGHDINLKNLSYTLGSGYGLYQHDFTKWVTPIIRIECTKNPDYVKISAVKNLNIQFYYQGTNGTPFINFPLMKVKITGLTDGQTIVYIGISSTVLTTVDSDGEWVLPGFDFPGGSYVFGFKLTKLQDNCNITITQIPSYQGGLIFDGIDDYGICDNMPIFTKEKGYTVCCIRKLFGVKNITATLTKNTNWTDTNGAFIFEYRNNNYATHSFGGYTATLEIPQLFSYQSPNSYNRTAITSGNKLDTNKLFIAKPGETIGYTDMVFYAAEIYDRNLSTDEINTVKTRMLEEWYKKAFDPAAQEYQALWTANGKTNADVDKNVPNLVDATNPLKLSNFAYAGNSGYQLFSVNFLTWNKRTETAPDTIATNSSIHFNKTSHLNVSNLIENNTVNLTPSFKVKVTGLTSTLTLKYISDLDVSNATIITKDGIYTLPSNNSIKYYGFKILTTDTVFPVTCDVMVEQIPEGEGLYLDGVDDSFTSAKLLPVLTDYTIVGDIEFLPDAIANKWKGVSKGNNWYWYAIDIRINTTAVSLNTSKINPIGFNSNGLIVDKNGFNNGILGSLPHTANYISTEANSNPQMNFKSFAIIPEILNEAQIRATYDYIKTLKANNI